MVIVLDDPGEVGLVASMLVAIGKKENKGRGGRVGIFFMREGFIP
jgi:hypothetical protein